MRGRPSAEFSFNTKIVRTFHVRHGQARLVRKESEGSSDHLGSKSEKEKPMVEDPSPPERLLRDYGGENAPVGWLTIVNQSVNVANF